jgi:PAS domain S-box-containing protein
LVKGRILIVEDEQIVAHELQQSLDARGYEVSIAETGEKALAQAAETAPNLVLLDIVLPGAIDGIAAAEQLQRLNIPVVYMTGYSDIRLFERAQQTEPFAYLTKPLRDSELDRVLQLALFKHRNEAERENERQRQAEAFRASEERFRRIVEQVTEYSIFSLDPSGHVNSWNSGAERIMQYSANEVLGKYYGVFFSEEDRNSNVPQEELEEAQKSGSADDTRWLIRRDGQRYWAEGVLTAIYDGNGVATGFTKISRDTSERQRIQIALKEREERLRIALQAARTGTWHWDLRTNVDTLDDSLRRLFGLEPDRNFESIEAFYAIIHPEERDQVIASFQRTLHEGVHLDTEFRVVWPDGSEHWLLDQGEVVGDQEGNPLYLTGACVDINDRKLAEQALRENEERFRLYAANVRDYALMQLDTEGRIVSWNVGAERVLGYSEAEILGQSASVFFTPEDIAGREPEKELERAAATGRSMDDRWQLRKDGTRFWASGVLTSMPDTKGRLRGFAKVMRDETEHRRAEEQLRASLDEKEVLLQEIHHRVKNNLQVINSLLRLQSQHVSDQATRGIFEEARNRVQAIAGIHELLYRSPDLARIDFGAYLNRLTRDLFSFFGVRQEQIRLAIHVNEARLEVTQAIPCGLLVNELVTNALKHAFPNERNGRIGVLLNCVDGKCTLAVEDNGVGFPEGFDWTQASSLGLQLVQVLTKQLDGTIRADAYTGTRFEISFPESSS